MHLVPSAPRHGPRFPPLASDGTPQTGSSGSRRVRSLRKVPAKYDAINKLGYTLDRYGRGMSCYFNDKVGDAFMPNNGPDADSTRPNDPIVAEMGETFFCAMISDVLDSLGHMGQALSPIIRPLDDSLVMVGRARTMLYADVYARPGPDENHYELEIGLVDDLRPGDVVVAACGKTGRIAPWGGLLSAAATVRGAAGAVMDGCVRDIRQVRASKFPVFSGGVAPLDSMGRGKVIEVDVPVQCGGVLVNAGDIVFGDADGCVVIPKALEMAVLEEGRSKLAAENKSMDALKAGRRLTDVYDEFGVL